MTTAARPHNAAAYHARRRVEVDEQILATARAVLAEVGLAHFSIERVALDSGVAKTTIYRRYDNRQALAAAAVAIGSEEETAAKARDMSTRALHLAGGDPAAAQVLLALAADNARRAA